MPFSSESGKPFIKDLVLGVKHDKILDVGCGSGTYAKMFPDSHLTGIEVWRPYVDQYGLSNLYDRLIVEDARTWVFDDQYDLAIAGDVLEHMTPKEAVDLVEKLKKFAKNVIISIPIGHYPQDEYEGNPYEKHIKDDWSDKEVRQYFGNPIYSKIDNEIGVYMFSDEKKKLKIAVYAISKNEEKFAERFCKAAKDADLIMVADTGSTDKTVEILEANGATVKHIYINPWRFDDARNAVLHMLPADVDVCVSLDLDEVLQEGWREAIEETWIEGTTRMRYGFDWGCGIVFLYEKIHARKGYRWHHPCHEYPVPDRIEEKWQVTNKLLVIHMPDPTKSRGQYLDLLRVSIEEDPHCPRNAFYYARELSFHGKWEQAIKEAERYLALPRATWINERCYAMRTIARCYVQIGNYDLALNWLRKATAEAPNTREPWCELAGVCYTLGRWAECYGAALTCLSITNKEMVYTIDPEVWGSKPHDFAAIASWNLKMYDLAKKHAQDAVDLDPNDMRLRRNLEAISQSSEAA
jgi:glycosyltransferase involved in cell wall biosynthesis